MLPHLLMLGALSLAVHEMMKPRLSTSQPTCQDKYCMQTWVDRPHNTLLKDQSSGAGLGTTPATSLREPYETVTNDYLREVALHPGVRLVAHAVA